MGDLEGAPAVHFNFPLLSFSLYIAFKRGLPLLVSLFLRNRGGLVNAYKLHHWFKSNGHFTEGVDFAYWWSCIGKGLSLQPAQQACFVMEESL